jgi:hypothetical protein
MGEGREVRSPISPTCNAGKGEHGVSPLGRRADSGMGGHALQHVGKNALTNPVLRAHSNGFGVVPLKR